MQATLRTIAESPHKKAPVKKLLTGAFGYCLLTGALNTGIAAMGHDVVNFGYSPLSAAVPAECVTNEKDESSFQCCIKDEGRPLIYALREEYINRFIALSRLRRDGIER